MKWYDKYLQVYGHPLSEIQDDAINRVRQLLDKRKEEQQPLASVVLIAHNEEKHLLSCLWSLCDNDCRYPIEIIVVNNHSTDRTEELLKRLGVTYYNELQKGPGFARQCGLDHSRGKLYLCIDADTLYPPHYLQTYIKELLKPGVVGAYSLWSFMPDKEHSRISLCLYEVLRDLYLRMQAVKRPELCVRGMAFGFHSDLGKAAGFRTDIIRGEDGSMALSLKASGKLSFITSRKARVLTSNTTINSRGSLWTNFCKHLAKAFKGVTGLFTKKDSYKDEESNLIK